MVRVQETLRVILDGLLRADSGVVVTVHEGFEWWL